MAEATPTVEVEKGGVIRSITIERFRGIKSLTWRPAAGLNVILGGGDAGKTTILEAVSLLLSPSTTTVLTDADYFKRNVTEGFSIEAVMSIPERIGISTQHKLTWPWEWDGQEAVAPDIEQEPGVSTREPVYRLRARGTEDLDLVYEIVQPDDTAEHFNVSIRRAIGLVRLSGDDRNDRDLRLVHGSALDRLLSDRTLRARLGLRLSGNEVADDLKEEAKDALQQLDADFLRKALPHDLSLGITSPQGVSLNALIGLTAQRDGVSLPLASWGSGTRRLAALEIAAIHQTDHPIVVVDEVERGLEPYRQRRLIVDIQNRGSQVLLTTHSTVVLRAAEEAAFWYLDASGAIGELAKGATPHRLKQPEAFLARLAIICEGATEVGFLQQLLQRYATRDILDLGIVVSDGCGNDETLKILEALSTSGLQFAGFADDEQRAPARWQKVKDRLGTLLFRWPSGCIESNLLQHVPESELEAFITPPDGLAGERLRTLAERSGSPSKDLATIRVHTTDLRTLIIQAATGVTPEGMDPDDRKTWKKHAERWFKSEAGGAELANKLFALNLWPEVEAQLKPFLDAILAIADTAPETPPGT